MNQQMPVVLVQLGSRLPLYALANIRTMSRSGIDVYVALSRLGNRSRAERSGATVIGVEEIETRQLIDLADRHARSPRPGLWVHSYARFRVLKEISRVLQRPFVHIENDVLLMAPEVLSHWQYESRPIFFGLLSPRVGSGAFVYVEGTEAATWLWSELQKQLDAQQVDSEMHALGAIASENRLTVGILPTAPTPGSNLFREWVPMEFRSRVSAQGTRFDGIFDVAGLGQYVFGLDPRLRRGFRTIGCAPLDHALNFTDADLRSLNGQLYLVDGGARYRVNNLHVHAKVSGMFSIADANSAAATVSSRKSRVRFHPGTFMSSAKNALQRRMSGDG